MRLTIERHFKNNHKNEKIIFDVQEKIEILWLFNQKCLLYEFSVFQMALNRIFETKLHYTYEAFRTRTLVPFNEFVLSKRLWFSVSFSKNLVFKVFPRKKSGAIDQNITGKHANLMRVVQ